MSNTDFRGHRALVRELIEQQCGQQPLGSVGERGSTSHYIGIHEDERDGIFKRWFTAASHPIMITSTDGQCANSSLLMNFETASNLLAYMDKITSNNHPPLILPSAEQILFIRERLPSLLTLHYAECAAGTNNCCSAQQTSAQPAQQTVYALFDEQDTNFLTRDEPYDGEVGFVLPVYSMPVPQLEMANAA